MSKQIWTHDGAVLATGVNSREEFVQLAQDDDSYSVLGALGLSVQSAREEIGLAIGEPRAYRVPVPHFRLEYWDGSRMYRCALDADPGRGFVKVLIFDPAADVEIRRQP